MRGARHNPTLTSSWPGDWLAGAECGGHTELEPLFFPERGDSSTPAKAICARCPVKADCLEFALASGQRFGVWGGMTESERRRVRRRRASAA